MKKVKIERIQPVIVYSELWYASECILNIGKQNKEGSSWQFLSSILMTAFSFEAYLNHVGFALIKDWEESEKVSYEAKIDLICKELNVTFPNGKGSRPLQTIKKLFDFRNTMAHGRTEILEKTDNRTAENYHHVYYEPLKTEWQRIIMNDKFALQARKDVQEVMEKIHDARQDEKEYLFSFGMGHGSATLID